MNAPWRRIALLAPLVAPIREPFLGGAQALVRDLAVTLARRGHDVTLYAASGTDPSALPGVRLRDVTIDTEAVRPADFGARSGETTPESATAMEAAFVRAFQAIAAHASEHDLIHSHAYDAPAFSHGARQALPIAHTLHMPNLHDDLGALLAMLAPPGVVRVPGQPWLVTVSRWCAETYTTTCRMDAVIPNGVDLDAIPFGARADQPPFLLFAGRLAPEKGAADAIAIARAAGYPLTLTGGVYDREYAERAIFPLLTSSHPATAWAGSVPHLRVWSLMAGATAVLVPSQWDEPFGLAACEAQAAGAPVIAYARGGLRDIIADGETGALITPGDIEAAAAAVPRMAAMDRTACRARVATRFSLDRMAGAHEALYTRMLES